MSRGHSSRASHSISVSSGNRFLAKSLSDFKLNFSVFGAIMEASLGCLSQFANLAGQFRQKFQQVIDDSDISYLKDGGFRIFVDGNDERSTLNTGEMLK